MQKTAGFPTVVYWHIRTTGITFTAHQKSLYTAIFFGYSIREL